MPDYLYKRAAEEPEVESQTRAAEAKAEVREPQDHHTPTASTARAEEREAANAAPTTPSGVNGPEMNGECKVPTQNYVGKHGPACSPSADGMCEPPLAYTANAGRKCAAEAEERDSSYAPAFYERRGDVRPSAARLCAADPQPFDRHTPGVASESSHSGIP